MANPQIGLLIPPSLPAQYCYPADPQQFANDLFSLAMVVSSTTSTIEQFYNKGPDAPTPEFQGYPWLKLTATNGAPISWFVFYNGFWVWPHPTPASGEERRLWVGIEADLETYDGGEAGAVDAFHGPFWEVDHDFDGRFPVGPGDIPGTAPAVTIGVGDTQDSDGESGEYKHVLTVAELPSHTHPVNSGPTTGADDGGPSVTSGALGVTAAVTFPDANTGGDEGHNTMPPYRGIYFIKRTARIYQRGA